MTLLVPAIAGAITTVICSVVLFFVRRSIIDAIDELRKDVRDVSRKINEIELQMIGQYARKDDLDDNSQAHKELWIELNGEKEKLAGVAKTIELCRHCGGKQ